MITETAIIYLEILSEIDINYNVLSYNVLSMFSQLFKGYYTFRKWIKLDTNDKRCSDINSLTLRWQGVNSIKTNLLVGLIRFPLIARVLLHTELL